MDKTYSSTSDFFKSGDTKAFEVLFKTYYPVLCIYAKKIVNDLDEARDIVQDVFVKIYDNRATMEINTSVKSYLYRSVHNACLNHLKRKNTHNNHNEYLKYQTRWSDNHDTMEQAELEEKIWNIIQGLPEQCRRIFTMNRFEDLKNKEIAEKLGISIRTVETQISKALKVLREHLADFLMTFLLLALSV